MHTNASVADIRQAFGPLTAPIAKHKRLLRGYEVHRDFRWHGDRWLRDIRAVEFEIRWALFEGYHLDHYAADLDLPVKII